MSAPTVVLLTDFGSRDWYAGTLKGVIKSIAPGAEILDLTHEIAPGDVAAAAFALEVSFPFYPEETVFCCVVDPGVGTDRAGVCATDGKRFFVAPDNGLLARTARVTETSGTKLRAFRLNDSAFFLPRVSATYHGRDVFAPVAAHIATGVDPARFGPAHQLYMPAEDEPLFAADRIAGRIVYVDVYGNLFTNIRGADLKRLGDDGRGFSLTLEGTAGPVILTGLSRTFGEVAPGEPLFYEGSSGYIEIAVNMGRADEKFGLRTGNSVFLSN